MRIGDGTKVDDIYAKLKELIVGHGFRPGEHLQINELSSALRVSITPVREALIRLSDEGLIEALPNKGYFVKVPDLQEIEDLYEHAFLLMRHSITGAAHALDGFPGRDALAALGDPRRGRATASSLCDAIERLYCEIGALSGNSEFVRAIRQFIARTRTIRLTVLERRHSDVLRMQMRQLAQALSGGDVEVAAEQLQSIHDLKLADLKGSSAWG